MAMARHPGREAGRGLIGFIIALAVVIYVAIALKGIYAVKSRSDKLEDYVYDQIRDADRQKLSEDDLKAAILARARELDVPLKDARQIEVQNSNVGWHAHLEWDDVFAIPGYSRPWHFEVEKDWKRF